MKKLLLFTFAVALVSLTNAQELIKGGNMENADDWTVVEIAAGDGHIETFNYTDDGPIDGEGGCLNLTNEGNWANVAVCQEITVTRGVTYNISAAIKTQNPIKETWVEIIIMDTIPATDVEISNFDIRMALNAWDCADSVFDGTFPEINCPAKVAEPMPTLLIEGEGDTTVTFVLKAGAGKAMDILVDNISVAAPTVSNSKVMANNVAFSAFPNPANNQLSIISEVEVTSISIISIAGVELLSVASTNNIDIAELPQGLYLVKVTDANNNVGVQKILKN